LLCAPPAPHRDPWDAGAAHGRLMFGLIAPGPPHIMPVIPASERAASGPGLSGGRPTRFIGLVGGGATFTPLTSSFMCGDVGAPIERARIGMRNRQDDAHHIEGYQQDSEGLERPLELVSEPSREPRNLLPPRPTPLTILLRDLRFPWFFRRNLLGLNLCDFVRLG